MELVACGQGEWSSHWVIFHWSFVIVRITPSESAKRFANKLIWVKVVGLQKDRGICPDKPDRYVQNLSPLKDISNLFSSANYKQKVFD